MKISPKGLALLKWIKNEWDGNKIHGKVRNSKWGEMEIKLDWIEIAIHLLFIVIHNPNSI